MLSPLKESFKNGSFIAVEHTADVVPFDIAGEEFKTLFVLVDGVYPKLARVVKGYKEPAVRDDNCSLEGKSLLEKIWREPLGCYS
jgi:hypothetical protein